MNTFKVIRSFIAPPRDGDEPDTFAEIVAEDKAAACVTAYASQRKPTESMSKPFSLADYRAARKTGSRRGMAFCYASCDLLAYSFCALPWTYCHRVKY